MVVDEAYIDFSSTESACALLSHYPNLIILQTLSKAFGLAGIRLGTAYAHKDIIQLMNNVKAPYNINKLTINVAMKAFEDLSLFYQHKEHILKERDYLLEQLQQITFVQKVYHTDSNFILFVIPHAQAIYKTMADRGVVCRFR